MAGLNIVIVDYQAGNLRSVQKALERSGAQAAITSDERVIKSADALVFPGQGACDSSMRHLREHDLVEPIKAFIRSGRPFFGVCLGLQLLLEGSDEGVEPGLGILKGRVRRLPDGLKIPHMGWNQVKLLKGHPVLEGVPDGSNFYFVHSYYADPDDRSVVAGVTDYGVEFCSVAAWENVIAVQFHPEKSGENGLKLYENFVRLVKSAPTQAAWR
ncbi:MAG: imidazole glycerol phosphate synthase subunit HisH [SAR202 cluster bacterium]|nr:imidazole glycerol phosphate synthase subunit HisH [SAR202 cluster bacterium]